MKRFQAGMVRCMVTLLLCVVCSSPLNAARSPISSLPPVCKIDDSTCDFAGKTALPNTSDLLNIKGGFTTESFSPKLTLATSKFLMQMALTFFNVVCWAVPLRSKHFAQNKALLSLANSFSGGIFLMLSMGHLLPESIALMATTSHGAGKNGVQALVYCLIGFMAMLFIEKVAFDVGHDHGHDDDEAVNALFGGVATATATPASIGGSSGQLGKLAKDGTISADGVPIVDARALPDDLSAVSNSGKSSGTGSTEGLSGSSSSSSSSLNSAVILCFAMSIHSFLEAAALGLSTDFTSAYMMTACIALHQPAESMALLVSFLKSGMPHRKITLWLTGFSTVALMGVSVGLVVNALANSLVESIVMAVTAGTFIYVGACEIASEEFEDGTKWQKYQRFGAYCAGMGLMAAIAKISEGMEGGHSH